MAIIVDGNKIANEILKDLRSKIKDLGFVPRLSVVLVGTNPASLSYIKIKEKKARSIGLKVDVKTYPEHTSQEELIKEISALNNQPDISGIIVQLPLPAHLDKTEVLNTIKPELDVDCLMADNQKRLIETGDPKFFPPAPAAILKILDYYKVDLKDAYILLVGSGDLVGKPLAAMLLHRKLSFETANRHTENLEEHARKADVIITGVGVAGLISGKMVKDHAVVIDAGTTGSDEGAVTGDVDFESVASKASLVSPVPGGVGPVTVAMLLANVVDSAFDTKEAR